MDSLAQDLRFAIRSIVRRPLFRAVAVLILALGLGATISVFTYLNGFYRPFPGAEAEGLVQLFGADDQNPFQDISYLDYLDYARSAQAFESVAAVQSYYAASVRHEEMTEVAFLDAVAGDYFQLLGVRTAIGRLLTAEDDRPEAEPAAVISFAWWQSRFHGDRSVLGSTLYLNYRPHTIVGVISPDFVGSASDSRPHVWIPIAPFRDRYVSWDRMALNRDLPLVRVYARLGEGVSEALAAEDLQRVAESLDQAYPPPDSPRRVHLRPATWIDPRARLAEESTNRILMLAAGGFLFLVCANVANLLLSVFSARKKEWALQAALGASRARLVRGVLAENVLLALLAGALAVGLAVPISSRLGSYFSRPSVWGENVSREFALDFRVVGFAIGISLLTGLLAGSLPAIRAMGRNLTDVLKTDPYGMIGSRRVFGWKAPGLRDLLMSVQVSLSVVLLVVSGLVLRTLVNAGDIDPGFEYEQLVGSHISTSSTSIVPEDRERFFREVEERISMEPWVRSATVSGNAPLSGHGSVNLRVVGAEEPAPTLVSMVHFGFFEKLGIDLVVGRTFTDFDDAEAAPVAVLNRPAAERLFPGGNAVAGRLWLVAGGGEEQEFEVVGVVGDTKLRDFLIPPEPAVYLPYAQHPYPTGSALLVTTAGSPEQAVPLLHRWLREFEPHLAIVNAISYKDVVRGALYTQRMNAELFSVLAAFGLILAGVGIFSVVSLSVTRRTREIGVRKAIGATGGEINRLVIRQALGPVVVGIAGGLVVSIGASRLVQSILFGVEPSDPLGLVGGSVVLLLTATTAAYLPALRAGRVDPVRALKVE
ncbi:MAG: ADOP family duplicated permease [Gemmatimonadota bacterium]